MEFCSDKYVLLMMWSKKKVQIKEEIELRNQESIRRLKEKET